MFFESRRWDITEENGPDIRDDYSEIVHYDDPDFKVMCRRNYNYAYEKFPGMSLHWHDDVEFIYITSGHCTYLVNGEKVKLNSHEGIFVNSRQMHLLISEDVDYTLECIIFHPVILCASKLITDKYIVPIMYNDSIPYIHLSEDIPWQKDILLSQTKLVELANLNDSEFQMINILNNMWMNIYQNSSVELNIKKDASRDLALVKKMIEYMDENYTKKITLDDICEYVGIGKTACTQLFTKYTGTTPIENLINYRISKSMELLINSDLNVSQIAEAVGFQNSSFFAETFKKKTGHTPLAYRKLSKQPITILRGD